MSQTLFEIGADMAALEELLIEMGGEIEDDVVEAALDAWFAEIGTAEEEKVDNYCGFIKELEARSSARDGESQRLRARALIDRNAAVRLKERLKLHFELRDKKKLETRRFTVSVQKNGGKPGLVLKVPVEELPQTLVLKYIPVPDNEFIRQEIEAGAEYITAFAELSERGTSLRIR